MTINNNWVGYLDRNFLQIKRRILTRMGETVPEVTDHSDSNILVVVIEAFAGVAEMLNYYIDNMAREAFITTCRRYSSAVKHTRLIDYRIKSKIPASVDITLSFLNNDDSPYQTVAQTTIGSGKIFKTENGTEFISIKDIVVPIGTSIINIPCKQQTLVSGDILGVTNDQADQLFSLGTDYAHDSVEITIGGDPWTLVPTLGRSGPLEKVYIVEVSANKEAFIKFGDGINGAIPTSGQNLVANYYTTLGTLGNVEVGTITNIFSIINVGSDKLQSYNFFKAVAGTDFEDIERIRRSAPLSLRTLERAVTRSDYQDIALLAPGVDKAKVFFNCGKYVYLYISPNGGGLASTGLCTDVKNYFDDKKMVTTFVKPLAAGESNIFVELEVTAKFRINGIQLRADIIALLLDAYQYSKSDINKPTRVSDLIALVDNYYKVDYLKLKRLYLKPYMRPKGSNTTPLIADIVIKTGSITTIPWLIRYDGYYMVIFKDNAQVANLVIGDTYDDLDNVCSITIEAGPYVVGMEWTFKTSPINEDIIIDDYSVPVMIEDNIELLVKEQLTTL
jgi:uncharacterized phage protein gp47/JayE